MMACISTLFAQIHIDRLIYNLLIATLLATDALTLFGNIKRLKCKR